MKEDFYCLPFPLEVNAVLFGIDMYYFTEKISLQRPKSKCISLCCVFNSFFKQKVHLFYAFKVSTVPVATIKCNRGPPAKSLLPFAVNCRPSFFFLHIRLFVTAAA